MSVQLPITTQIGILFLGDIENSNFVKELWEAHLALGRNKKQPIYIYFDSHGGDVFEGFAIIGAIKNIQKTGRKVIGHVCSRASSMASVILQVCDERICEPDATMVLHEISYEVDESKLTKHKFEVGYTKYLMDTILNYYVKKSHKDKAFFRRKLTSGKDWLVLPKEALALGLIDEITQ